jgi:hypothetical protein
MMEEWEKRKNPIFPHSNIPNINSRRYDYEK